MLLRFMINLSLLFYDSVQANRVQGRNKSKSVQLKSQKWQNLLVWMGKFYFVFLNFSFNPSTFSLNRWSSFETEVSLFVDTHESLSIVGTTIILVPKRVYRLLSSSSFVSASLISCCRAAIILRRSSQASVLTVTSAAIRLSYIIA